MNANINNAGQRRARKNAKRKARAVRVQARAADKRQARELFAKGWA